MSASKILNANKINLQKGNKISIMESIRFGRKKLKKTLEKIRHLFLLNQENYIFKMAIFAVAKYRFNAILT